MWVPFRLRHDKAESFIISNYRDAGFGLGNEEKVLAYTYKAAASLVFYWKPTNRWQYDCPGDIHESRSPEGQRCQDCVHEALLLFRA